VRRAVTAWGPAVLWAAAIFWASSRPSVPLPEVRASDKLAHFGAYAVLGLLAARGATAHGLAPVVPVVLGVLYGASDELHQHFVPGRSPEIADWVADSLGVLAGVLLFRFVLERRAGRAPARPLSEP
jgi:VanZ family protein